MVKPRIAIVGLGLIGGSLARRLVNAGCEVTAWNHNDRPYATAEADGIICKPTLAALAETKPNVLVLCNPLKAMPEILGALKAIDRHGNNHAHRRGQRQRHGPRPSQSHWS